MSTRPPDAGPDAWSDDAVDQRLGNLLRAGVMLAAAVTALGGVLYLVQHGHELADRRVFHGQPPDLRSVRGIVAGALQMRSRWVIQLGLLLLIATPVARVLFSLYAFVRQRDTTYVAITAIVLALLVLGLLGFGGG
ncbi:MAG TPA: DUF1634 domain-containing protein [Gemmatimonadaceae bacterium]|nr:DUF1634 domain-containing protein [Gemmatimonadaceae bacterium]